MNILLDIPRLTEKPLGMQIYIENVIKNLLELSNPQLEFTIRTRGLRGMGQHQDRLRKLDLQNKSRHQVLPVPLGIYERVFKNQLFDYRINSNFDLIHSFSAEVASSHYARLILTIQDVIPLRLSEGEERFREIVKRAWNQLLPAASKIITISEFSKKEIVDILQVDPAKIEVIYNGVDHEKFNPITDEEQPDAKLLLNKLRIPGRYLLHLGGLVERKNISRLVEAFEIFKRSGLTEHKLVLAGANSAPDELVRSIERSSHYSDIILCGYLSSSEAVLLLKAADALIFPSTYEGFGMPPLEAMACGVPTAISNAASLPEVGGDASVYFDPLNVSEMANVISHLVGDANFREKKVEDGLKRSAMFSWADNARKTIELYDVLAKS